MKKHTRHERLSLKLEKGTRKFLWRIAKAQGHTNISRVVKGWIAREMQAH